MCLVSGSRDFLAALVVAFAHTDVVPPMFFIGSSPSLVVLVHVGHVLRSFGSVCLCSCYVCRGGGIRFL